MGFRADFHHVAADGDLVLTERTDYLRLGGTVRGLFRLARRR